MPTPSDLARIDARLQRFWARYGMVVDFAVCAIALAAIAFCVGYAFGVSGR